MAKPSATPSAIPERNWVNIQWLARLRWAQIAGQAATVFVGQFLLDGALPILGLLGVIGVGLVSNLYLELYFFGERQRPGTDGRPSRPVHEWQTALVMMLDIAILTALLYLTGGTSNPFAFLYLVQIALSTVLLRASWTWMLVGLSFVSFGVLLVTRPTLEIPEDSRAIGMWVALGVASAFVVYFLRRINLALAVREAELSEARELAARQERLASLATMAAGAAHELSTPLGTVALAAKELERALTKAEGMKHPEGAGSPVSSLAELAADARLIREQVGRCRVILDQMQQGAGTVGEGVAACSIGELIDETLVGIRPTPAVVKDLPTSLAKVALRLPPRAVSQALRSLVTNAQDASPATTSVVIVVRRDDATLAISIRDRGPGIPAEVLERIGEPFFTTKAPGRGMGLGLFLARAVIEGVGGTMQIDTSNEGTEVRVRIPTDVATGGPEPTIATQIRREDESSAPAMVSKPA
ncbi:MAG: ATP-binding protein [Kofleriaceae bacterium]